MKYFLLNVIILLLLLNNSSYSQLTYDKQFSFMTVSKTIPTKDGGFLIAGERSSLDSAGNTFRVFQLIRVDNLCDTLWTKSYFGTMAQLITIVETFDSGFILAGLQWDSVHQYDSYISIIRLDSSSNIQWTQHIPYRKSNSTCYLIGCTEDVDSNIVILGSSKINFPTLTPFAVDFIKLDKNGVLLMSKKIFTNTSEDIDPFQFQSSNGFKQSNDGSFLITGRIGLFQSPFILRLDRNGNVLRCKKILSSNTVYFNDIKLFSGGNYFLYGRFDSNPLQYPLVVQADSLDSILWAKCYPIQQQLTFGISDLDNSGGSTSTFCYNYDYLYNNLVHIDSFGGVLWTRTFPYDTASTTTVYLIKNIIKTPDDGYLLAAYDNRLELIKTDSLGNANCRDNFGNLNDSAVTLIVSDITSTIIDSIYPRNTVNVGVYDTLLSIQKNVLCSSINNVNELDPAFALNIYPNPTKGGILINFSGQQSFINVAIINVFGQEISSKSYSNALSIVMEIKGSNGLYYLKISDNKEVRLFKVLKI